MASNAPPPPPASPRPPPLQPSPSETNLEVAIRKCIPKELIPEDWHCTHIDNKDSVAHLQGVGMKLLGMFESFHELYDTVFDFMDFPRSYQLFKIHRRHGKVERFPYVSKSVKGKWCIYQNEMHKFFDHSTICPYNRTVSKYSEAILDDCWRVLRVGSLHKMIACPYELMPPTLNRADLDYLKSQTSEDGSNNLRSVYDFKQLRAETAGTIGSIIFGWMDKLTELSNVSKLEAITVIAWVTFILDKVIKLAREGKIHLPPLNILSSPKEQLPVIRLFSIDKNHFVMVHDLLDILKEHGVKTAESDKAIPEDLRNQRLSTFSYQDAWGVLKEVGNADLMKMEFAKMRSDLLMFNQTPIPTWDKGYCILAVDALYELLMDIIVAKKVFHTFEERDWIEINKFFKTMESRFDIKRGIYFMDLEEVEDIKKVWEACYNKHLKRTSSIPRLIILRDRDEFTVSLVENELKRLEIDKCFENILQYANPIFLKLRGKSLSLSNLHIAVARCQVNCLVRKVPWILRFIKKQTACNRMNIENLEIGEGDAVLNEVVEGVAKLETSDKKKNKNL